MWRYPDNLSDPNAPRLPPWFRWGLLFTAQMMAASLAFTTWFGYTVVRDSSMILARGQGLTLLRGVGGRMFATGGTPAAEDLNQVLRDLEPLGLRYIAVHTSKTVSAGEPRGDPPDLSNTQEPLTLTRQDDRMRLLAWFPPGPRAIGPLGGKAPNPWSPRMKQPSFERFSAQDSDFKSPWFRSPGSWPPGVSPRGMGPAGMGPRGIGPPSISPPGIGPPGMNPSGMNPSGMNPPGMNPSGMNPPGMNPPGMGPPGFMRPGMRPAGQPWVLAIEFEPETADGLVKRGRTSLLVNSSVASALMLFGLIGFTWMRRRARTEVLRVRARHLATLGEMSAVLAHEIRNPLTSLKGYAQLLAESLDGDAQKQRKAQRVVNEAIRLEVLTTDLLDFVRTDKIRRSIEDPKAILERAADEVDSDRIIVEADSAPERWSLDPDRIQQALSNLLRNALQVRDDGLVNATVKRAGTHLVYEVRDRGNGVPEENLAAIFEPFHTTKAQGTGLGLAVVRQVVELHGGRVTAENHPEGGAKFRIELPEDSR